jgi:hypothetical protein
MIRVTKVLGKLSVSFFVPFFLGTALERRPCAFVSAIYAAHRQFFQGYLHFSARGESTHPKRGLN